MARIGCCVRVPDRRSRHDLFPAEPHIEGFLTDLAVHGHMPPTTRHQAMPALMRLDTRVSNHAMKDCLDALVRRPEAHRPDGRTWGYIPTPPC
jgi:hypothetical protein